jgi:hypothetical protein
MYALRFQKSFEIDLFPEDFDFLDFILLLAMLSSNWIGDLLV